MTANRLRDLPRVTLQIRSSSKLTTHVLVAMTEESLEEMLRDAVSKALSAGHTVIKENGSREWISSKEFYDPARGYKLTFHEDGNRCLWIRSHVKVAADGTRTETKLRSSWRKPEGF